jgi:hypothetical protein
MGRFFDRDVLEMMIASGKRQPAAAVLLLTATVKPGGTPSVGRVDAATRLNDYREALSKWLADESVESIVFCENSGYDLSTLADLVGSRDQRRRSVEFLSLDLRGVNSGRGKGWGELRILNYIVDHSKLLASERHFLKVTGRYYVRNAGRLLNYMARQEDVQIWCDLRRGMRFCDSRVFGGSVSFLARYVCPRLDEVDEGKGVWLEHVLARAVLRAMSEGLAFSLLPYAPKIQGVSGTTNTRYRRSLGDRVLRGVRTAVKWYTWMGRLP